MRIPKAWIPLISKKIINDLLNKDLIIPQIPAETLVAKTEKLIMDELMAEDRLNEEVREILKKFSGDIEKGRLVSPSLTTIHQPLQQMGRDAVDILLERVGDPMMEPVQKCYKTELIVRQTA